MDVLSDRKEKMAQRLDGCVADVVFFYRYFIKLGILDGKQGFIFCVLQAFWFRFLVDANVYEIKQIMKNKKISLEEARKTYP